MLNYGRRFEILIDDEIFIAETGGRQFRIQFEIIVEYGGAISYCDLAIFGLSKESANKLFKRGAVLSIRAGYVDNIDYIFRGKIKNVLKEREGADVITRLLSRGGSQDKKTISRSLGENTELTTIIKACADAMGYALTINSDDFVDIPPYMRGYTMTGDPKRYLDKLSKAHGFSYAIENDRIVVIGEGSFRKNTLIEVSQKTGMEGIPEVTEVGCDVSVRLNPALKIGARIDVQSELSTFNFSNIYFQNIPEQAGKGVYRIFKIEHSGDSYRDTWTTKIKGIR